MGKWMVGLLSILLMAVGVLVVLWSPTGEVTEFCTLDAPLEPPPAGWEFRRDSNNGCAMTLFDEDGNRAPDSLYAGIPMDPPPAYPNDWDIAGWLLIGTGLAGAAGLALTNRRGRQ